jgi:hypothetical protein
VPAARKSGTGHRRRATADFAVGGDAISMHRHAVYSRIGSPHAEDTEINENGFKMKSGGQAASRSCSRCSPWSASARRRCSGGTRRAAAAARGRWRRRRCGARAGTRSAARPCSHSSASPRWRGCSPCCGRWASGAGRTAWASARPSRAPASTTRSGTSTCSCSTSASPRRTPPSGPPGRGPWGVVWARLTLFCVDNR